MRPAHLADFVGWFSDPEVTRYLLRRHPPSLRQEARWLERAAASRADVVWAVLRKDPAALIGVTALHRIDWQYRHAWVEISLGDRSTWGQGYATETLRLCVAYGFAELGLETPDGKSRQPDHDIVNAVLEQAYQRVVDEVERRYDPILAFTNPDGVPADDAAGLELVRGWREGVWRNAERLTNAKSEEERRQVADSIYANAATWAQGIAAFETPGDRARRDAYCASQAAAGSMD